MNALQQLFSGLNIRESCRQYRVGLWQCPQFLFVVMGIVIIISIVVTNVAARLYTDPEVAALIVLIVTAFLFIVGTAIVRSFEKVALSSIAKSEFISVVSHEMRNPLSTIKWHLNSLEELVSQSDPEMLKETLVSIKDQNARAIRLVNQLLAVYKVEDNKLEFKPSPFSVPVLAERVVSNFEQYARANNVSISIMAGDQLPAAFADKKQIQIVLEHLIDNAIKYSEKGGQVSVTIENRAGEILCTISDQGVGIPESELQMLFQRFYRAHNRLRYHTSGLGLGLYLAKYIIRHSGGELNIQSSEGKGTTVWFSLPVNPL